MKLLGGLEVIAKVCVGPCGLEKPIEEFNLKSDAADGRQSYCRACGREATGASMRRLRELERRTDNRPRDRFDSWAKRWLEAHPEREPHG